MADPKVRDWPESERSMERLLRYGADSLSDAQLLAIILRTGSGGKGVPSLSMELLDRFRGLKNIDTSSVARRLSSNLQRQSSLSTIIRAETLSRAEMTSRSPRD